jgi:hypothetical protein
MGDADRGAACGDTALLHALYTDWAGGRFSLGLSSAAGPAPVKRGQARPGAPKFRLTCRRPVT